MRKSLYNSCLMIFPVQEGHDLEEGYSEPGNLSGRWTVRCKQQRPPAVFSGAVFLFSPSSPTGKITNPERDKFIKSA